MTTSFASFSSRSARPGVASTQPRCVTTETSDADLIKKIAAGDKGAMKILFARHHLRVYRFIVRFLRDEPAAEDLLNDVFLEVWRKADTFEGRSQVSTWLLGIARHRAITLLRRRATEEPGDDAQESVEDPADNPEVAIQKNEKSRIIRDCLMQLSPQHREIIDLVYYHEKPIVDVAEIVGITLNTVKTRMFYARKRLAVLLGTQGIVTAFS
jgi:RNA polymerase sigma-70 factor (ECF subfamily)